MRLPTSSDYLLSSFSIHGGLYNCKTYDLKMWLTNLSFLGHDQVFVMLVSFYEHQRWLRGPYTRCSVTFGSSKTGVLVSNSAFTVHAEHR